MWVLFPSFGLLLWLIGVFVGKKASSCPNIFSLESWKDFSLRKKRKQNIQMLLMESNYDEEHDDDVQFQDEKLFANLVDIDLEN